MPRTRNGRDLACAATRYEACFSPSAMESSRSSQFVLFFLAASALFASSPGRARADGACSPIRLDETVTLPNGEAVEGSMVHVAVRNQRAIGSCYAHTAVQMYDAWRFRHGERDREDFDNYSSGYEIGQRFKINGNLSVERNSRLWGRTDLRKERLDTSIDGGYVAHLMPFLQREGTCSQLELNGLFEDRANLDIDQYASEIMTKFEIYRKRFHDAEMRITAHYFPTAAAPSAARDQVRVIQPSIEQFISRDRAKRRAAATKEIDTARAEWLEKGIAEVKAYHQRVLRNKNVLIDYDALVREGMKWSSQYVNTVKMFEILSVADCPNGHHMKARGEFKVRNYKSYIRGYSILGTHSRYLPDVMKAVVNGELDQGLARAYPVAVGYCSAVLKEGRAFQEKEYDSDNDACGRHDSLIIGRRPNPSDPTTCQYLIRNSWGRVCTAYHSDWGCDLEKGSVWVDAETLGHAVHDLQTLNVVSE